MDTAGVTVVAATERPFPGLSPDGSMVVYPDTVARRFVVAAPDGRLLDTFDLPADLRVTGWHSGSKLLTMSTGQLHRIRTMLLDGGPARLLFESGGPAWENPAWSADGNRMLFTRWLGDRCELRIVEVDGEDPEAFDLGRGRCDAPRWSPDGRRVAYGRLTPGERPALMVLDLETGRSQTLHEIPAGGRASLGPVDDRGATIVEMAEIPGGGQRAKLLHLPFAGGSEILGEFSFPEGTGTDHVVPVDASSALLRRGPPGVPRDYRLIRTAEAASNGKTLLRGEGTFVSRWVRFSDDRRWVAFLMNPEGRDFRRANRIELVRVDGGVRHTVSLPFFAAPGDRNPLILPGGESLMVTEFFDGENDVGVYLVDVGTGATRKLFDGPWPEIAVTPDGRTLVYRVTEQVDPSVFTIDLSPSLEGGGR